MALSPAQKQRIENAKRGADIRDVIESTGAQAVRSNHAKGEFTYHAPYREDSTPSLMINVNSQSFCDYGMTGAHGDVIQLTRLILGHGDANNMPFFEAVKWLERRAGGSTITPEAIKPLQREKKPIRDPLQVGRFTLASVKPVNNKTHPNNLDYIHETRKIGLKVASRYLWIVGYKDNEAAFDDQLRGMRYGIGWKNDSDGYDVRAPKRDSKFKMVLGPKDVTTIQGSLGATTGHVFESMFDFLSSLELTGRTEPTGPTIILNSGAMATRAAEVINTRPELQSVQNWHVWQQNDDEGERSTVAFAEALGDSYTVGTLNHYWQDHKDLNAFLTTAPDSQRATLKAQLSGSVQLVQKSYDTSVSAEARRTHDAQRGPTNNPSFF
jgi:hypothetical protein